MNQLSLFDEPVTEYEAEVPDVQMYRAFLSSTLRMLNHAEVLPWTQRELERKRMEFSELVDAMPEDEGAEMLERFNLYIKRLQL